MRLNVSSAKWRPFCLGLNGLRLTDVSTWTFSVVKQTIGDQTPLAPDLVMDPRKSSTAVLMWPSQVLVPRRHHLLPHHHHLLLHHRHLLPHLQQLLRPKILPAHKIASRSLLIHSGPVSTPGASQPASSRQPVPRRYVTVGAGQEHQLGFVDPP